VRAYEGEIEDAVLAVVRSGWYLLGPRVTAFENDFAAYLCADDPAVPQLGCVGVASGTDALELALRACGVKEGDVVVSVSHTASATIAAIRRSGAVPAFVDIQPDTMTLDPGQLEALLTSWPAQTPQPKAVVPVHLYGHPCDMDAILDIAERHGLMVVEDCAQAHGAMLGGRRVGTFGDAAAFSFYPTKNLAALGDAGAVVTPSAAVADRVRRLRQYGWQPRFVSVEDGCNSRMDELQAAILGARLRHLEDDLAARRQIAGVYALSLGKLASPDLVLPRERPEARHVYHQYVVRCADRPAVVNALAAAGVGTAIHYPVPAHRQPAFARFAPDGESALQVTEEAAESVLSLPMFPELGLERAAHAAHALTKAVSG
jgi:dTDP-4-amino-4,6-dideoxygalactose transaminase